MRAYLRRASEQASEQASKCAREAFGSDYLSLSLPLSFYFPAVPKGQAWADMEDDEEEEEEAVLKPTTAQSAPPPPTVAAAAVVVVLSWQVEALAR